MRNWLIGFIGGPLGFPVRGIISAITGTLVGMLYAQAWVEAYKVSWIGSFTKTVVASTDPDVLHMLTPAAIGAVTAAAVWGGISAWIINHLKLGNRSIQQTLNANPAAPDVREDGIITKDGETAKAVQIISRAAYEAVYLDDTGNRGKDGMPEIRKPLP